MKKLKKKIGFSFPFKLAGINLELMKNRFPIIQGNFSSKILFPPEAALIFLVAISMLTALLIPGCVHIRRGAASLLMPVDEEIELGRKLSAEMEKELTLHSNPEVQKYIRTLGSRLVRAAGRDRHSSMNFTFKVVDDPETVNAFALPGGWIYIYSGLLLNAETEAEVAAVLAHEIAHVTKRHIAERLAAAYGLQALTAIALGQDASTLKQMSANILSTGYLLKFSREQEVEADITGVKYTIAGGWNPEGFITFFMRMGGDREAGSRRILSWISTHPMPEDRIEHIRREIASHSKVPDNDARDQYQRFLAMLDGSRSIQSSGSGAVKQDRSPGTGTTGTGTGSDTSTGTGETDRRPPPGTRGRTPPPGR